MGKKASARIKNKVKARFARSINHMEKMVAKERVSGPARHHQKKMK